MHIPTTRRAAVIAIAATVLPLATVATSSAAAQATTRRDNCAVTPLAPVRLNTAPVKSVRYSVRITCLAAGTVILQQNRRELDGVLSQDLGTNTLVVVFATDGSRTVSTTRLLPNTEAGNEEIFQRVRFRVVPTAAFTPWESSAVVSMAN